MEGLRSSSDYSAKIDRLGAGERPRVLDLFAGCGGISLGFDYECFEISAALELDPRAAQTHAANFHGSGPNAAEHAEPRDITATSPEQLVAGLGFDRPVRECIDVIVGGPPCQSFARVGRAKLREVLEHPAAFRHDPRSSLYLRYLDYVDAFRPLALLVENVPDVINHGGHNVPHEMCEVLEELGYVARYTLLNAANYGVPQMRDRMFLLAYREEIGTVPTFPAPTHWVDLPKGYHGTRSVALKHERGRLQADSYYVEPPVAGAHLPPAVTARDAVGDLPPITKHLRGEMKKAPARFDELARYQAGDDYSAYVWRMRNWPDFEARSDGVLDHVIRYLPRDYPIFARMEPGDQYPQAHAVALTMLAEEADRRAQAGNPVTPGTAAWGDLVRSIVPPYDPGKFPNKWRKMSADEPARTLMAHIGKDTYSHIHFDSDQARTISVREAARLQSFPDGFVFSGRMNAALRQIGNAVPPLMAAALAREIGTALAPAIEQEDAATLLAA